MNDVERVNQPCTKARYEACANQCRIAKFCEGGTIFDGNCPCERPVECRFDFGSIYVNAAKENFTEDEIESKEAELLLFPDVKNYIGQVYQEYEIVERLKKEGKLPKWFQCF